MGRTLSGKPLAHFRQPSHMLCVRLRRPRCTFLQSRAAASSRITCHEPVQPPVLRTTAACVTDNTLSSIYPSFTVSTTSLIVADAATSGRKRSGKLVVAVHEARAATLSNCESPQQRPSNIIDVFVDGVRASALIDTGAAVSVMNAKLSRLLRKVTTQLSGLSLRTASAQSIHPTAVCTARVVIRDAMYAVEFIIIPACSHDIILGWDFLSRHNAVIHCTQAEIELSPFSEMTPADSQSPSNKLLVTDDTQVPPNASAAVSVYCDGLCDTIALLSPCDRVLTKKGLLVPFATVQITHGTSAIFVSNPSPYTVTLVRGNVSAEWNPSKTHKLWTHPMTRTGPAPVRSVLFRSLIRRPKIYLAPPSLKTLRRSSVHSFCACWKNFGHLSMSRRLPWAARPLSRMASKLAPNRHCGNVHIAYLLQSVV